MWRKLYTAAEHIISQYRQETSTNLKAAQLFESWAALEQGSLGDAMLVAAGCFQNLNKSIQSHSGGSCLQLVRALLYELKQVTALGAAISAVKNQKQVYQQTCSDLEIKKHALEKFQIKNKCLLAPVPPRIANHDSNIIAEPTIIHVGSVGSVDASNDVESGPTPESSDFAIISTTSSVSLLSANSGTTKISPLEAKTMAGGHIKFMIF